MASRYRRHRKPKAVFKTTAAILWVMLAVCLLGLCYELYQNYLR
ncbi:hypothetical protein [Fumia xinanensis]|nr:hypothetical protein [Fumia xinanensis]